jgi:hypothetical protein
MDVVVKNGSKGLANVSSGCAGSDSMTLEQDTDKEIFGRESTHKGLYPYSINNGSHRQSDFWLKIMLLHMNEIKLNPRSFRRNLYHTKQPRIHKNK